MKTGARGEWGSKIGNGIARALYRNRVGGHAMDSYGHEYRNTLDHWGSQTGVPWRHADRIQTITSQIVL